MAKKKGKKIAKVKVKEVKGQLGKKKGIMENRWYRRRHCNSP